MAQSRVLMYMQYSIHISSMPVGARSLSILFLTQTGLWILSLILIFFIFSIIKVCRRVYTFYLIDFRGWDDWSIIERAFKYSRYIYIYLFLGALSLAQLWFMADSNCSFIRAVAFTYYYVMCCGAIYLAEAFIFFF